MEQSQKPLNIEIKHRVQTQDPPINDADVNLHPVFKKDRSVPLHPRRNGKVQAPVFRPTLATLYKEKNNNVTRDFIIGVNEFMNTLSDISERNHQRLDELETQMVNMQKLRDLMHKEMKKLKFAVRNGATRK